MINKSKNYLMGAKNQIFKNRLVYFLVLLVMTFGLISSVDAVQSSVNLGTAGNFVILSQSGISTTGTTSIVGDIGVSPIASTAITGFGLIMDSSNQFSTSSLVTGNVYASEYAVPTPASMTTAISDMSTAYTDAAGRTIPDFTELGAGNIDGLTLTPGLYKWGTGVGFTNGVTLSGGANDIWIFQIAEDLTVGSGAIVTLSNGAQAKNIFWQVAGQATLGTTSVFEGIILSQTAIVIDTGATLNGRALAQTAVTLDSNAVTAPRGSTKLVQSQITTPNNDGEKSGSEVITTKGSGAIVSVTNSRGIVNIVAGVSVTRIWDGETIEVTSVEGRTRLKSNGIEVETELPVEVEENAIRVTKSNGAKTEIKIMPITASETAIERLKLKVCTEENNCTIVLKEVGTENKLAYQVKAQKDVKVIGLFRAKMNVEANIDAETNEVISEKIPWWYSISKDAS